MGQLERYGLYVLCLVIFLILGVAIWGTGPDTKVPTSQQLARNSDNSAAGAKVLTPDDHRRRLEDFTRTQRQRASERQKSAEDALFKNAKPKPGGTPKQGAGGPRVDPVQPTPKRDPVPPAPAPKPVGTRPIEHRIEDGDSFASLAAHYLGDQKYYLLIQKANPQLDPRRLKLGDIVKIPPRPAGKRGAAPARGGLYRVKSGESPWTIARKLVGTKKATAYAERIMALNNITNAHRIDEGDLLKLPPR